MIRAIFLRAVFHFGPPALFITVYINNLDGPTQVNSNYNNFFLVHFCANPTTSLGQPMGKPIGHFYKKTGRLNPKTTIFEKSLFPKWAF